MSEHFTTHQDIARDVLDSTKDAHTSGAPNTLAAKYLRSIAHGILEQNDRLRGIELELRKLNERKDGA